MNKVKQVKELVETTHHFMKCRADVYTDPLISSIVFFINADGYCHIFKAPFGLLEVTTSNALADIIINEILEWKNKYEA